MTDTFRKDYKSLSSYSTDMIVMIKDKAEEMELLLGEIKNREMSLAMTNLEQSIMWATKAIVLQDEKE